MKVFLVFSDFFLTFVPVTKKGKSMEMEQMNRIELKGRIDNVRIQNVGNARNVRFAMATNYVYKDKSGCPVIETTWHRVSAWDKGTELQKGDYVHVVGRLRNQRYTDCEGIERTVCEVVAREVEKI